MVHAKSPPGNALHGLFDSLADFVACVYHSRSDSRADKVMEIQNAMSERVPGDGGLLVPEEYRNDLVEASLEGGIIRPYAQVYPMRSLRLSIPAADDTTHSGSLLGGWTASWTEEAALITDTTPGNQRDTLEAKKLAAFTTVDNELFEDAAALQVYLRRNLPKAVRWYEEDGYIAGSGQGEPKGVLTANCAVQITRSSLLQNDVVAMVKRLWPQAWQDGTARFLCGPDTLGLLADLYQPFGTGEPTNTGLPNNPWFYYDVDHKCWRLAGVPLYVTEHTAAAGTAGDLALIDPSAYIIGDREVMTIQVSPHPKWNLDQSVIRVRHRVDGRMWPNSPVTPASGAATVSPVVVLQ